MPPALIRISSGVVREDPAIARQLNLSSKCVVVEDANTRKVAGATVVGDLKREGYVVSEVLAEKPDIDNVIRVQAQLEPGDFVIGVGGTSVLDVAKHSRTPERSQIHFDLNWFWRTAVLSQEQHRFT